jgi:hypothetical protein
VPRWEARKVLAVRLAPVHLEAAEVRYRRAPVLHSLAVDGVDVSAAPLVSEDVSVVPVVRSVIVADVPTATVMLATMLSPGLTLQAQLLGPSVVRAWIW